ncbi:MAG: type I secretion system permease/ATPase [Variibacter sp.]|nr:type I secretion system permease/ATPase [Variibacter sp.]
MTARPAPHPAVAAALRECRRAFLSVAVFSGAVNVLMLAGPIYMLQVYDRVLASHSVPTLIALSGLLVGAYGFQALMDLIRARIVVRAAALLDRHLGTVVHRAVVRIAILTRQVSDAHQPVRDLDQIRSFLTSPGPIAIVDLPWMPAFLFICYLIHPWLGLLASAGGLLLVATTVLTERASRQPSREVQKGASQRATAVEADRRNSETIVAMGLGEAMAERWTALNERYLASVERSSDIVSSYGSLSRVLRLLLQSAMLGLGAFLVIRQELTPGAMIAASIMMGRALAPIETAITNWRGFVAARDSLRRLADVLARVGVERERTELPKPHRSFSVERLVVAAPDTQRIIVNNVNFRLKAGEALGIVGPSGSGKTSLVRALVGAWRPARGSVRIDGAALEHWSPEQLGPHVGYLSQAVELFDGTVAENIARMRTDPDPEAVIAAARAAGAHDMILRLPAGYDTRIGDSGTILSAGQRQRVALARALFGNPFLVVLDEPNANLDAEGEAALLRAIVEAKARGAIVIMIAHRAAALSVCDKVLLLRNGAQHAFGPRDEVLSRILARAGAAPAEQSAA